MELARAVGELARIGAHGLGDVLDFMLAVRQKFVQRRIEQPDGDRQPVHDLEQRDEIRALHGQQLRQRGAATLFVVGEDHLAHRADALALEEHVLGAAKPDALRAELDRDLGVGRRVGVGAHLQRAHTCRPTAIRVENSPESSGSRIVTLPASTWPVEPSMVITSPFFSVTLPTVSLLAA